MPFERIGYRRLYDAVGCSIASQEAIDITFPFGEQLQVRVYIGPKPIHGIVVVGKEDDDYRVAGGSGLEGRTSYHKDATQSGYHGTCFTEIICSCNIEVSAQLSDAFQRRDTSAVFELFHSAETQKGLRVAADAISGILGLRFHKQLVLKLINEHFMAFAGGGAAMVMWSRGSILMLPAQLNETDVAALKQQFPLGEELEKNLGPSQVKILTWLLHAWSEREAVPRFIALFIALETVLSGVGGELSEELRFQVQTLRDFIAVNGGEKQKQLTTCLDAVVNKIRPSLVDRFEALAKAAGMPSWKGDVEAFKKFNKVRNSLVHRGDPDVSFRVPVSQQELRFLEDLAERYINYALFGDAKAYESLLRSKPGEGQPHLPSSKERKK